MHQPIQKRVTFPLVFSFLALYIIWGSTYFAIRIGVEEWPPLRMAAIRFLLAGTLLGSYAWLRGARWPCRREWLGVGVLGVLMLVIGNGLVTLAERDVSSSVAALMAATVPLFTMLFSYLLGRRARLHEWASLGLGLVGVIFLNMGANLIASPQGALWLIIACIGLALGSALSNRLPQPTGLMSSACMMLSGGIVLLVVSGLSGETVVTMPSWRAWAALFYLVIFGSIIAYTAYLYLLAHVSVASATSYAYVNPVIAVLLGMFFLDEQIGTYEWVGMVVIIVAVLLLRVRR